MNMQDFYTGHAFDAYEFFGAHTYFGGTHFAVLAPSAQHIAVETEIGTFDLHRTQSAVWECDAPGVQAGMVYQYWVRGANGQSVAHCDPYGTAMTLRPDGRSIVSDAPKGFADDKWMQERTKCFDKPLNIYEVHAGSWRQKEDGSWYTYAELADLLPAYCKKNGFTHIELMPLAEHPFDGSWGYQITGFFAPTSRYGTPDELAEFVNACHKQGIGVILDFVPVHFAVDAYGLKEFDGTPLAQVSDAPALFGVQQAAWDNDYQGYTVDENALYAVADSAGNLLTDFQYQNVCMYGSDLIAVQDETGNWGYCDKSGNEVIPCVYQAEMDAQGLTGPIDYAFPDMSGIVVVQGADGAKSALYTDGTPCIEEGRFEDLAPAQGGCVWAKQNGLWGLLEVK